MDIIKRNGEKEAVLNQVRAEVRELTDAFPLYEGLN